MRHMLPDESIDWYWAQVGDALIADPSPWVVAWAAGPEAIRPEIKAVADMLFFPALPSRHDQSLLQGVCRITPPEHEQPPGTKQVLVRDIVSAVNMLDDALRRVISSMVGDRAVGVLVTGGLDSALVAAIVADVTGRPPRLVAIRGGLSSPIEERLQAELAEWLDSPLATVDTLPTFDVEPLIRRNQGSDFPSGGAFTHIWEHASCLAFEQGVEVLLNGEGGNERFSPGALLAADLLPLHPISAASQAGRSRDSNSSLLAFVRAQIRQGGQPTVVPGSSVSSESSPQGAKAASSARWLGPYAEQRRPAEHRRRRQLKRLRKAGHTWTDADARIALERHELFDAGDTAGFRVLAPLSSTDVGNAVARVHPTLRNPVRVGTQDKHLLRLVARRYLPPSISETRKVGISNQLAVLTNNADVSDKMKVLEAGWEWLGFDIDSSFGKPYSHPVHAGLLWTRMLAFGAWGLNALAPAT